MEKPSNPFVTIILPVRNEAVNIFLCLDAIRKQDFPNELVEIIVMDGMSNDDTCKIIYEFSALHQNLSIKILDNHSKIVSTAMNVALRKACGEIVIRVDGHCIVAPDYVSKCVEHIQKDGVDGVGGSIETVGETFISKAIAIGMSSPFGVGNSAFRTTSGKTMLVDTVPFPAYNRKIIERVGLYDEELVRNQDDEYNYRIREMGGKILLANDIKSIYISRSSLKGLWNQYFQYGYWKVRVLQKHPRQMSLRQFVPPAFIIGLIGSALLSTFSNWGWYPLAMVAGSYLFANIISSTIISLKKGWKFISLLPVVFAILHVSYGLGFLVGLLKFVNRWGDKRGKTPAYFSKKSI